MKVKIYKLSPAMHWYRYLTCTNVTEEELDDMKRKVAANPERFRIEVEEC